VLKIKTVEDYREEFAALLKSGKYWKVSGSRGASTMVDGKIVYTACALNAWYHQNHGKFTTSAEMAAYGERTLGVCATAIMTMNDHGLDWFTIVAWVSGGGGLPFSFRSKTNPIFTLTITEGVKCDVIVVAKESAK
jgi:hypothetical protein